MTTKSIERKLAALRARRRALYQSGDIEASDALGDEEVNLMEDLEIVANEEMGAMV